MSMLTVDYSDIIKDRKLMREMAEKDRPTSDVRQLKWRKIERVKYKNALKLLKKGVIQIG